MKKVGIFSDLHADKANLELIVRTLRTQSIGSALFLGDAVYKTMADFTNTELNKAYQIREQLKQASPLRTDVLEGLFSDEQLKHYQDTLQTGKRIGRKIARAEYQDIYAILQGFDLAVLGGNWDYGEELAEVFGDSFLNAQTKEIGGLKVTGFSGGGSPSLMTARTETLADGHKEKEPNYHSWARQLLSPEPLQSDLLISHVPFTDGEGVEKENAVEHLKELVKKRKRAGKDLPDLYLWGHRHGSGDVRYDRELEGFVVAPGCSGRNHNSGLPTFMVGEFDDQNKLVRVNRYQINSSLSGLEEVRLAGSYQVDQENKTVEYQEANRIVIREKDLPKFKNNLALDGNIRLARAGLNINYSQLSPKEKDSLLRRNLSFVKSEVEALSETIQQVLNKIKTECLTDSQGKLAADNLEEAIALARRELAQEARKVFGVSQSQAAEEENCFIDSVLVQAAFGIEPGNFYPTLRKKNLTSVEDLSEWGQELLKASSSNLTRQYQQYILQPLEIKEFQNMAEVYIPSCYERTKDFIDVNESINFWAAAYQEGLITSGTVEETGCYQKKLGFTAGKRTKEQLAEMFDFKTETAAEPEEDPEQGNPVPPEFIERLMDYLKNPDNYTNQTAPPERPPI